MKILLIIALCAILFYFLSRRLFLRKDAGGLIKSAKPNSYTLLDTSPQILARVTRNTLWTVGIGIGLFFLVLILGMKIKILWIALPLSLYLIGQLIVLTNHVKTVRNQRIYFDPTTDNVIVQYIQQETLYFNLLNDPIGVSEVKSVQKNRGTLFGYYKIRLRRQTVIVPYLIEQHGSSRANSIFFERLRSFRHIEVETRLFPII
ncbi:MAG TPA: hypothetical protein VK017_15545 [Sphingobacterium sp.]|nr:hypothetical protein [Sphingobacterium sp.]